MMTAVALGVAACSSGNGGKNAPKLVSASGTTTTGIVTDGASHVAYLLNAGPSYGTTGELHVADAIGNDTKIATGMSIGAYAFSGDGKGLIFAQANASGDDANLQWVDMSNPASPPTMVFAGGLQTQPINPGSSAPTFTVGLTGEGFFSPSGRYYVCGVLQPNVGVSPDLHVVDVDTGTDVFTRANGAFDYLELVLPNDVMVFQDAVGGNSGVAGGAGLQTLFWVDLTGGSPTATTIDTRTGAYTPTGDNKTIVYQNADARELYTWDAVARPAAGTKVASNALTFAVAGSGPIAYLGTDGSFHVVGLDGTAVVDVDGATAKADPFSPVVISDDGADAYYFQAVDSQDSQGTLMHVSATAGATPNMVASAASIGDVHPQPGGVLLYLAGLDAMGVSGNAFQSARDGSGATALGTKVPVGFLQVQVPATVATGTPSTMWMSAHLFNASEDMTQRLVDGIRAISGGLELTTTTGTTMLDPMARIAQLSVSDDFADVVYVGGSAFDSTVDNYVGGLSFVPVATPTMKPAMPLLTGVSEVGTVVKRQLFVNAPKASKPGVYLVTF
jgi:hypothetical protein